MAHQSVFTHSIISGLLIIGLLGQLGCIDPGSKKPVISEGTIHYRISYPPEIEHKSFSFLLPDKMDYSFITGNVRVTFKGSMGLYALDFISDHHNDSSITLLKVLDNKMYVPASESKRLFIFKDLKSAQVTLHKDTTRVINGYLAHRATISNIPHAHTPIQVWYTRQIKMKSTYKNTPYAKIPGMMLEFELIFNGIQFKLKAESVDATPPSPASFTVPPNYKATSIEEIETMISSLLN